MPSKGKNTNGAATRKPKRYRDADALHRALLKSAARELLRLPAWNERTTAWVRSLARPLDPERGAAKRRSRRGYPGLSPLTHVVETVAKPRRTAAIAPARRVGGKRRPIAAAGRGRVEFAPGVVLCGSMVADLARSDASGALERVVALAVLALPTGADDMASLIGQARRNARPFPTLTDAKEVFRKRVRAAIARLTRSRVR